MDNYLTRKQKKRQIDNEKSVIIFQYKEIGDAFVNEYYSMLDNKDESVYNLFEESSKMTFNNGEYNGINIINKLRETYANPTKHEITNIQSMADGSRAVSIQVTGNILINESGEIFVFTQFFHLLKGGGKGSGNIRKNTFWIKNTMFMMI
jgi:hypothetical protein